MYLLHPVDLLKPSFGLNWVQKTETSIYEISRMLFSNMDFNFAHFAYFDFVHFEIEESLWLIYVKLQYARFDLQISISGIQKVLVSGMAFIFAHFVYKRSFGQIWVKITE